MQSTPDLRTPGEAAETVSLGLTNYALFVAHSPGNANISFLMLTVDGVYLNPSITIQLPGSQGVSIELGRHDDTKKIEVKWVFKTGSIGWLTSAAVGYIPNGDLRKRKILMRIPKLEDFKQYEDSAIIPI